jgi:hypothetical protein
MEAAISYIQSPLPLDQFHAPRELEHPLFSLTDVSAETLVWIQPQWMRPAYELWAGDRVVATLRFRSLYRSQALAASAEGLWTFERDNLSDSTVIRQGQKLVATLEEQDAISSVLKHVNGSAYVWVRDGIFGKRWAFVNVIGKPVLYFAPETSPQARLRVEVSPDAIRLPQLTFLALLGKYIMLARRNAGPL